jgi:Regulator of ribonuclease activity B
MDAEAKIAGARQTLEYIAGLGEDLSKPRHVMYFFYGEDIRPIKAELETLGFDTYYSGDVEYAGIVERHISLKKQGYEVERLESAQCVVAERQETIGECWRTTTLREMHELAARHGLDLDGWQASLEETATIDGKDN